MSDWDHLMKNLNKIIVITMLAFILNACASSDMETAQTANVRVSIPSLKDENRQLSKLSKNSMREAISDESVVPAEIDSILVEVYDSQNALLDSGDILLNNGEVTLTIPAGENYTVVGQGLAGSETLFRGEANIASIAIGDLVSVNLSLVEQVLFELTPIADISISAGAQATQFNLNGLNNLKVNWYVNGQLGGNAEFGTIDESGVYTPPAILPANTTITITAEPVVAASFAESFQLTLLPPVNILPIANAGSDLTVNATDIVNLSAIASSDSDGTITSYAWNNVAGDFNPALTNANTSRASFTAPSLQFGGVSTFRVTVTDDDGATATDDVVITVNGTDQALVANAGIDQTVTEGDTGVTLDGSASNDPDNAITTFFWQQISGTNASLSNVNIANPTFTAPDVSADEDLVFRITVTNDASLQATDTVTIRVNNTVAASPTKVFFAGSTDGFNFNIYVSDGTAPGTQQLGNIAVENGQFSTFKTIGDNFYFRGDDGVNGRELWRTDGTVGGTEMLPVAPDGDYIAFGAASHADPNNFLVLGDRLLFGAVTSNDGTFNIPDFLSLDTTADPVNFTDFTEVFSDRPTGGFGPHNNELVIYNNFAFFSHTTFGPTVNTLYRTDGTNTAQQVATGFANSSFHDMTEMNGELYFVNGTQELWKTDGTTTSLIKTFSNHVGYFNGLTEFYDGGMITFNNQLFFVANDGEGSELWKSDGTGPGTVLVSDLDSNIATSTYPYQFRIVNGNLLFFSGEGNSTTDGLWITDGTAPGTTRLAAIGVSSTDASFTSPGYTSSIPTLVNIAGQDVLFFMANDGVNGNELWVTDGTIGGTQMLLDLNPGAGSSFPTMFRVGDEELIFSAQDADGRAKLWKTDGTAVGTSLILDLCPSCFDQSSFFPIGG